MSFWDMNECELLRRNYFGWFEDTKNFEGYESYKKELDDYKLKRAIARKAMRDMEKAYRDLDAARDAWDERDEW